MAASSVTVEAPAESEINQPQIQDGLKNTDNYAMAVSSDITFYSCFVVFGLALCIYSKLQGLAPSARRA